MQTQSPSLLSSNLNLDINMKFILFLALSLFLQGALGDLICEELPVEMCTLSIDSDGKRCVLESSTSGDDGKFEMQCQTSEVYASNKMLQEYIETDECVSACGVDRQSLGLSSDSLLDSKFITKLCSNQCYNNCPNIVDLYSNLAAAEGVSLPEMCSSQKNRLGGRRGASQLLSSGAAAPVGGSVPNAAPSPSGNAAADPPSDGSISDAAPPPSENAAVDPRSDGSVTVTAPSPSGNAVADPPSQY